MKRVRIILTQIDGMEMLTIKEPMFVGIVADRFVIEDKRGPMKPPKPKIEIIPPK
jgi:hypothetical protein